MKKSLLVTLIYIISLRDSLLPLMACMLPAISCSLSISRHRIQFTLTAFFIGLLIAKLTAISGLVNKTGNKKVLLLTIPLSAAGLLLCLLPWFISFFIGCIMQGLGIGMIRAIASDIIRTRKSGSYAKTWTQLSQIPLWAPVVITFAGCWILQNISWQFNMISGFILTSLAWLLVYLFVPYDNVKEEQINNHHEHLNTIKKLYISPAFICYTIIYSMLFSIEAIFYTAAPFIFTKDLNISSKYFYIFILIFIFGGFTGLKLNNVLEKIMPHRAIILLSCFLAMLISIFLLVIDLANILTVYSVVFSFGFFSFSACTIEPSVKSYLAENFKKYVIISSAVVSCILSLVSAVLSMSSAYLIRKDIENLSFILFAISTIALIAALITYFPKIKSRT